MDRRLLRRVPRRTGVGARATPGTRPSSPPSDVAARSADVGAPAEVAARAEVDAGPREARIAAPVARWFAARGWRPFAFQRAVWDAVLDGESGLLHATTGAGKTHAAWFAALNRALCESGWTGERPRLSVLWLTPMRALAADTQRALAEPLAELGLGHWQVGLRTGDTSPAERQRQARSLPTALVTTPESLSLMLARASAAEDLGRLRLVVVDEWHELIGSKRGVQVQLALARLRRFSPGLIVWGLSATLGNLDDAMDTLLAGTPGRLVRSTLPKRLAVDTLMPPATGRFPWGGHLGLRMLDAVAREVDASASTLIFTNTRSQAELWYQALLGARPDWAGLLALHHGSLDRDAREWVEAGLKAGRLRAVVCTSSLDLGVDFSPVERVLQIGSAKGVARLLQRAGRSGHAPGRVSRITLVPTNALELLESAAAQDAVAAQRVEPRTPPDKPLDVLVQHLVTIAAGTGFVPAELLAEVRGTRAYRDLTDDEWRWALAFCGHGGDSLRAYPEYRRIVADEQGVMRVPDRAIARRHRMSIGTIVSDASLQVKFLTGQRVGTVEEGFVARLRKGDRFVFAGRVLELVRVHEMTAWVRRAADGRGAVPRWAGGRMPLSSEMADAVLDRLDRAAGGAFDGPEMTMARPLLELQSRWSVLPRPGVLPAERLVSREGHHLFVHAFAGRHVHLGLAALIAWRVARASPATFAIAVNDYGFELLSPEPVDWSVERLAAALAPEQVADDVLASLNASELARRRFREIARVSGLVFQGFPGAPKSTRQLQASAGLFYDVFRRHDPGNLLLGQAEREVLEQELEIGRLRDTLARIARRRLVMVDIARPTPLALPLMVERMRERLSTEQLSQRVARMVRALEAAAR